jgi:hypothetical protein
MMTHPAHSHRAWHSTKMKASLRIYA